MWRALFEKLGVNKVLKSPRKSSNYALHSGSKVQLEFASHTQKPFSAEKQGVYHNLDEQFSRINRVYFQDQIKAEIRWGKNAPSRLKKRHSIQLGSYCSRTQVIRIHPQLDQAFVPALCVARIVYHEMLHQKCPPRKEGRKNLYHPPEFKQEEALFQGAQFADQWFKTNLTKLLT